MKALLVLLLSAGSLLAQSPQPVTSATLDESEVRITYGELKRLVAATLPKEAPPPAAKPAPPVSAALLSALYLLDAKAATMTAEMQVENFDGEWHAVPLAGAAAGVLSVEPKDARLVVKDEQLCLITDKAGAQQVKLSFAVAKAGLGTKLHLAAAPIAALEVKAMPEGKVLRLQNGAVVELLAGAGTVALPAQGGDVNLILDDAHKAVQPHSAGVTDDALVSMAA